jgi:predicted DNA binding CopG/RHH family protein
LPNFFLIPSTSVFDVEVALVRGVLANGVIDTRLVDVEHVGRVLAQHPGLLAVGRRELQIEPGVEVEVIQTSLPESVERAQRDDRVTDEVMVSTSIRLPQSLMRQIRERAAAAGIPATTLIRQWVIDRMTASEAESVISVDDLKRFIAERAHPAA